MLDRDGGLANYDTWRLAKSMEHFDMLVQAQSAQNESTLRQLCLRALNLFQNLPYSPITWLYLVLLGAVAALYGLLIDEGIRGLLNIREYLYEAGGSNTVIGFMFWASWCSVAGVMSTACGHFLSPSSDGSGIPIVRALFAGVYQNPASGVLSMRTFLARSVGTILSSASGLSVGKSGPYTHLVATFAYHLGNTRFFRRSYFGPESFSHLRAAVACGITACFGSPLGGVLYSIEVTTKYYEIKCLWEGVIGAAICMLVFRMTSFLHRDALFEKTSFERFDMDWDMFAFLILGVLTGLTAGLFCKVAQIIRIIQQRLLMRYRSSVLSWHRRLVHVLIICMTTAALTYPMSIMRLSNGAIVNEVFRREPLSRHEWTEWTEYPLVALMVYTVLKFVLSVLPCGAPISQGVFAPLFTIGAVMGRLYGETLMKYWNPSQSPAAYAVVGAACFASSATQTVSTSVIFFELTGQLSHLIPVMLSCIVAYFVSGTVAPSIYDILAEWAGLHAVCFDANEYLWIQQQAFACMKDPKVVLTRETTYAEALVAMESFPKEEYFPVCESKQSAVLLGSIRRHDLQVSINRFRLTSKSEETSEDAEKPAARNIFKMIADTLSLSRHKGVARIEDMSLLNSRAAKEKSDMNEILQLGPPFSPWSYTSVPIDSYPPQVGEYVSLNHVRKIASMAMWTEVYVVHHGHLVGTVKFDSTLHHGRRFSQSSEQPVMVPSGKHMLKPKIVESQVANEGESL